MALADYYRTVELGLSVCLRKRRLAAERAEPSETAAKIVNAILFGSDQGLVGQFNDVLADFVANALAALPGEKKSGPLANGFTRGSPMPVSQW